MSNLKPPRPKGKYLACDTKSIMVHGPNEGHITHWHSDNLIQHILMGCRKIDKCCLIGESTLVEVMVWRRHGIICHLNQCWPRPLTPYGITRPINDKCQKLSTSLQWTVGSPIIRNCVCSMTFHKSYLTHLCQTGNEKHVDLPPASITFQLQTAVPSRALVQDLIRRLIVRPPEVSKLCDWQCKSSSRSAIWQAHQQHCCWGACRISERVDNSKYKSRGFETLGDHTIRRLIGYWIRGRSPFLSNQ